MSSNSPVKRPVRMAERIRSELMEILLRGTMRDPRLRHVTVTHVAVTDDLQLARAYVRLLETDVSERRRRETIKALQGAAGFLRKEVGAHLATRYTPELRFYWDESIDHANRMERIFAELHETGELTSEGDHEL